MNREYEFWYNWDYARRHNPTLMCLGTTGGYGAVRAQMRGHVKSGNKQYAEECFWSLIDQTIAETQYIARDEETSWRDLMHEWLHDIYTNPGKEYNEQIAHFVRPKWRTPQMHDTNMDLYPDNMCIPIVGNDIWEPEKTFVQRWGDHITWCLNTSPMAIDPMEYGMIY